MNVPPLLLASRQLMFYAVLSLTCTLSASSITVPAGYSWTQSSDPVTFQTLAGKVSLSDLHITATQSFVLPQAGESPLIDPNFTVSAKVGLDGLPPSPVTGGIVIEFDAPSGIGGGADENPTESFSLLIIGPPLPGPTAPIIIRDNPLLQSVGRTTTPNPPDFTINSFFDVFTEISLDSAATWTPADNALNLASAAPIPSSLVAGSALLICLALARRYLFRAAAE